MSKSLIVILVIISSCYYSTQAQFVVGFSYDPSGNRIERNMILLPPKSPGNDQQTEEEEYKLEEQKPEFSEILNNHEITIFPNPNGGQFDAQITNLSEVMESSLALYSIEGKEVFYRNKPEEITHINIQGKKKGTYVLKILLDGEVSSWKIVKQ